MTKIIKRIGLACLILFAAYCVLPSKWPKPDHYVAPPEIQSEREAQRLANAKEQAARDVTPVDVKAPDIFRGEYTTSRDTPIHQAPWSDPMGPIPPGTLVQVGKKERKGGIDWYVVDYLDSGGVAVSGYCRADDLKSGGAKRYSAPKDPTIEDLAGPKPKIGFNGKIYEVDAHLKTILRDPDSLVYYSWTAPTPVQTEGGEYAWSVGVEYGARNGFGGMNRSIGAARVRDGKVINWMSTD